MTELRPYYVVLYPTANYFRHFLVFATGPHEAVHKVNYQARRALPIVLEQYPNDAYGKVERLKDIIRASRRYLRNHTERFATGKNPKWCKVNEIPTSIVHEGQIHFGVHTESLLLNLLPDLIHPLIGNE